MQITQPYHLLSYSPWPISGSMAALLLTTSLSYWFHMNMIYSMLASLMLTSTTMLCWWRDVLRESTYTGEHSTKIQQGLQWGMILFITSEVMFFSAFFWAFFHSSLSPTTELGCSWPPNGTWPINPLSIPLLNTAVLLASGVTITHSHHNLLINHKLNMMKSLSLTSMLGLYFTYLQLIEYMETSFSLADSIYGNTFFVATGFHGAHVLIGTTFLLTCLGRMMKNQFSSAHHFGLEAAAWYWHFVDVVWILLFLCIYWWGGI